MTIKDMICGKCQRSVFVKNGTVRGVPKIKCKHCGAQSDVMARPEGERIDFKSHPEWMRYQAITLYFSGLSMIEVGTFLKVGKTTVMRWIRDYEKHFDHKSQL